MFSVALIGPDGAGKTTVGKEIERSLGLPVKYLYMGVNTGASNFALPTTRAIAALKRCRGIGEGSEAGAAVREPRGGARSPVRTLLRSIKNAVGMTNRILEEWYRQAVASYYQVRGQVVLYDRHFLFDFYHPGTRQAERTPLLRRFHVWMLLHVYPRPELVICLDAPAEVMFARKGEFTIQDLDERRRKYLRMGDLARRFVVVDATQPVTEVVEQVRRHILDYHAARGGSLPRTGNARA